MKALSIRQPWAWLIMKGIKDIETRDWPAPESLIGETIAIHAGLKLDKQSELIVRKQLEARGIEMPSMLGMPVGRLLGEAKLFECIRYKSPSDFYSDMSRHLCIPPYFSAVRYGFVLKVTEIYKNPPPLRGQLKFFDAEHMRGIAE